MAIGQQTYHKMASNLPDVMDEELLCCRLCLRNLSVPKILPCLHILCKKCLEKYIQETLRAGNNQFKTSMSESARKYLESHYDVPSKRISQTSGYTEPRPPRLICINEGEKLVSPSPSNASTFTPYWDSYSVGVESVSSGSSAGTRSKPPVLNSTSTDSGYNVQEASGKKYSKTHQRSKSVPDVKRHITASNASGLKRATRYVNEMKDPKLRPVMLKKSPSFPPDTDTQEYIDPDHPSQTGFRYQNQTDQNCISEEYDPVLKPLSIDQKSSLGEDTDCYNDSLPEGFGVSPLYDLEQFGDQPEYEEVRLVTTINRRMNLRAPDATQDGLQGTDFTEEPENTGPPLLRKLKSRSSKKKKKSKKKKVPTATLR